MNLYYRLVIWGQITGTSKVEVFILGDRVPVCYANHYINVRLKSVNE